MAKGPYLHVFFSLNPSISNSIRATHLKFLAKFDVHIYHGYTVICKSISLPFIMYYVSALLLFTRKLHMSHESLHIMELLSVQCPQVDDVIPILSPC